jgi:hypothetical protein
MHHPIFIKHLSTTNTERGTTPSPEEIVDILKGVVKLKDFAQDTTAAGSRI